VKVIPEPTNPAQLVTHQKEEAKLKRIILDFVKDHFISHIVERKNTPIDETTNDS